MDLTTLQVLCSIWDPNNTFACHRSCHRFLADRTRHGASALTGFCLAVLTLHLCSVPNQWVLKPHSNSAECAVRFDFPSIALWYCAYLGIRLQQRGNETGSECLSDHRIHGRYHMGSPSLRLEANTEDFAFPIPLQKQQSVIWRPTREGCLPIRRRLHL
jgi:hypothetical protein